MSSKESINDSEIPIFNNMIFGNGVFVLTPETCKHKRDGLLTQLLII